MDLGEVVMEDCAFSWERSDLCPLFYFGSVLFKEEGVMNVPGKSFIQRVYH